MATSTQIRQAMHDLPQSKPELDFGPRMQAVLRAHYRAQHRYRQSRQRQRDTWRYIVKHKKKLKKKPVRVSLGMMRRAGWVATRSTARGVAKNSYRASRLSGRAIRATSRVTARGYRKRIHPKVAGHAARAFDTAQSKTTRLRAHSRVTRRKVAGRLHEHAATMPAVNGHHQSRRTRLERFAADAIRPTARHAVVTKCAGCGAEFRTVATAAKHTCGEAIRQEQAAINRARHVAGHGQQKPATSPATPVVDTPNTKGTPAMANNAKATNVHSSVAPKNKTGKHIDLTGFEASTFAEWLDMCYGKAREMQRQADGLNSISEQAEGKQNMDPRAVAPLALAVEAMQTASKLFLDAYITSYRLYSNRVEEDATSGRRMRNEDQFFGKK